MSRSRSPRRVAAVVAAALALLLAVVGCSRADSGGGQQADQGPAPELRLGFFPNVTHAPALIGVQNNLFAQQLGPTRLTTQTFNAGPDEVAALLGGSLDVAFIGSGPAINAYKQNPQGIRLIAGATSGGAQLVVRPGITTPQQLLGRKFATPQQGNTQDIAFKKWLRDNNLPQGPGPGAVEVQNIDNARAFDAFRTGQIDGGWLPEPFASRFILEAGAVPLVDERTLWPPDGRFPTTVVIARTDYVQQHPATISALLRGLIAAEDLTTSNPAGAQQATNAALTANGGRALSPAVTERSFSTVTFGPDPLAARFPQLAQDAVTAGVAQTPTNLAGLVDVGPLNAALAAAGRPPVDAAGLSR